MSKQAKALRRLAAQPKDFTWKELVQLLKALGYELRSGSGSRRKFHHPTNLSTISLHEPHPSGILKAYQVRQVVEELRSEGYF